MNGFFCSLIELDLRDVTGEIVRICDGPHDITYTDPSTDETFTYRAYGTLLEVDKITYESTLQSKELEITLSGVTIDFQEAVNNNLFRRKSIKIFKAFVEEGTDEIAERVLYWQGLTNTPSTDIDYNKGYMGLQLSCRSIFDLDQTPSLMRCNAATHEAYHAGDKFYQYANVEMKEDAMWRERD
ncbi:hypothetical protein KGV31_002174 [Vibrio parahaemolyticus]|nr:hypothetical protein [Vibrio parahaemolyticus]EHU0344317.1 hypothetical protein [Vibrio parahaemolyticus]EHU0354351.1 hypothetical protein [Vibrio parahaemolyticus]